MRNKFLKPQVILLLAFFEGGLLMAAELIASRIMAPLFGSSVYVWGVVLSFTLLTLSAGYFTGSYLFDKIKDRVQFTLICLTSIGISILFMPLIGNLQIIICGICSFHFALFTSASILLLPPIFLCGILSPTLVGLMHEHQNTHAAISAGRIYAISTLGGVFITMLTAYILLPKWGIRITCLSVGFITIIVSISTLFFYKSGKYILVSAIAISMAFLAYFQLESLSLNSNNNYKIQLITEGIIGQIIVADFPIISNGNSTSERHLFVNGIIQTSYISGNPNLNNHDYFKGIESILRQLPPNSPVLILGLGGGILANYACSRDLKVDAVELDSRIVSCSREYFSLNPSVSVYTEDARTYIRNCSKKYACILIDLFRGEEPPGYFFTQESFAKMKQLLTPAGKIIMNSNGFYSDAIGAGNRSIMLTMKSCGLSPTAYNNNINENQSSMIILADNYINKNPSNQIGEPFKQVHPKLLDNDIVLTDNRPILDVLNQQASLEWRKGYLKYLLPFYKLKLIPLFL